MVPTGSLGTRLSRIISKSGEDFLDNTAVDVAQSEISTGVTVGQCFVIQSQQGQQRGMEVVHVNLMESPALCRKARYPGRFDRFLKFYHKPWCNSSSE